MDEHGGGDAMVVGGRHIAGDRWVGVEEHTAVLRRKVGQLRCTGRAAAQVRQTLVRAGD
jgi:hypothetical protein